MLLRTVFGDKGGTTYEYMYNAYCDVVTLLSDGEAEATYYYDAFGNIREQTGAVDNSILYAGYQYDEETGLYYINARMYDPVTARFLQADTYLGSLNDPLSLNLYTYCLNNPERYTDPSGHFAITAGIILSALFWGAVGAATEYRMQKNAGGIIDYNQVIFQGVLNTSIAIISGGLANGGRMAARSFGRMMLAEAGLGVAEGIIGDTGRQLIGGTKFRELDYGHIAATGVLGGFSGVGGALLGEGIGVGVNRLMNTRVVNKMVGGTQNIARNVKGKIPSVFTRKTTSEVVENAMPTGMRLQFFAGEMDESVEDLLALPAPGQGSFNVGERLVSKEVFEEYIKGKTTFSLGAPGTKSFFFNKPDANTATRSFEAAVNAGFTKQNILDIINSGGNELVRIRFDLTKVDQITIPGVSKIPGGVGDGVIPGVNRLFTGKGYTQNYLGKKGYAEYIARNVTFTQDDLISYQYLGKIKK